MNVYEALYTTRSMRRMTPDPIPDDVQARILDAAIRAPSPSNTQRWRFLLVDDPAIKRQMAPIYQENAARLFARYRAEEAAAPAADQSRFADRKKVRTSAEHLAEHWAEVPLFLIGFVKDDPGGNSIVPALWSAMLAARAEGVGSTYTTILGAARGDEVLAMLGVPPGEGWTMAACIAMGYPTGKWGVPARTPVDQVAARNRWDGPLGFSVPEPLWPGNDRG